MQAPSVALLDPGGNPSEECWMLDWLEPVIPELPAYTVALRLLLQNTAEPAGIGAL